MLVLLGGYYRLIAEYNFRLIPMMLSEVTLENATINFEKIFQMFVQFFGFFYKVFDVFFTLLGNYAMVDRKYSKSFPNLFEVIGPPSISHAQHMICVLPLAYEVFQSSLYQVPLALF